jgi:hypothetical protein
MSYLSLGLRSSNFHAHARIIRSNRIVHVSLALCLIIGFFSSIGISVGLLALDFDLHRIIISRPEILRCDVSRCWLVLDITQAAELRELRRSLSLLLLLLLL